MDLNNIVFVSEMSGVNDIMNCITIDNKFNTMCFRNTFMGMTMGNTFGNDCNNNTFGNNCGQNTFGNSCDSNTFGNSCGQNTFGNGCGANTFGNGHLYTCRFGDGVNHCNLNKLTETNNAYINGTYLRNIIVLNGTDNVDLSDYFIEKVDSSGSTYQYQVMSSNVNNDGNRIPSLTCGYTWDSDGDVVYQVRNTFETSLLS